jgi:hypothetical protein
MPPFFAIESFGWFFPLSSGQSAIHGDASRNRDRDRLSVYFVLVWRVLDCADVTGRNSQP